MPRQLDSSQIVRLAPDSRQRIEALAQRLDREGSAGERSGAELAELGAAMVTALPVEVVRTLHRFGNYGGPNDALLLRGLMSVGSGLQPTPATATPAKLGRAARLNVLALLGVSSLLGEPFTFSSLHEGRLVQHVTPVPGQEDAQTSGGSDSFLAWHVEDAWSADRCDYFGLLCLRGDSTASTLFSAVRATVLDDRWTKVLRQPRFVVRPDIAHGATASKNLPAVRVLSGSDDDPEICFDALYLSPRDPDDTEAGAALRHAQNALENTAAGHVLESGDLLIVDNRRVVHARTSFRPRYDGADRWLLRTMICASLRTHRRRGASRAIG